MTSKLSRANPGGSILTWQVAHSASCRCLASCSRIVVAPRMSGSTASTSTVGLGGGVPRMRSSTHAPRRIGDVVVPLAVTFSTPAIVRRSEEHTSELQSRLHLVCRLLLEKKKNKTTSERTLHSKIDISTHHR